MAKRKPRSRCYIDAAGRRRCPRLGAAKKRSRGGNVFIPTALPPAERPCFHAYVPHPPDGQPANLLFFNNDAASRAWAKRGGATKGHTAMWGCPRAEEARYQNLRTSFTDRNDPELLRQKAAGWTIGLDPYPQDELLGIRGGKR